MAQTRRRKPVDRKTKGRAQQQVVPQTKTGLLSDQAGSDKTRQKYFHIFAILILLGFGSYISFTFYGHQAVPNSDFPAFGQTARELLSFDKPSSFKRTPGLGMLHVLFGYLMPGPHPELTAGWVLNAIFYALIVVLLYLVGREILGPSAIWYAIIASLNPWTIAWMCHPIVETPLIFFVLLAFYLTMKHSRWSYAAAMMASMIRYEGAAMILIAFVGDIIHSKTWRPILWATLASIPLFLATLLLILPPLTSVIKIPLLDFRTLYDIKRFALTLPACGFVVLCLIAYHKQKWAYVPAGIASVFSLAAGLLFIVTLFALDMYKTRLWRKIVPRLLLLLLASLPMFLWLYGTKQAQKMPGRRVVDYSTGYSPNRKMVIDEFSEHTWELGVSSLFVEKVKTVPVPNRPGYTRTIYPRLWKPSQILFCISLALAVGYAIYKKQYSALLLIFFLFAYFLAHATRNGTRPRYAVPIAWLILLVGWYGLRCGWLILSGFFRQFRAILLIGLSLASCFIFFLWFVKLVPHLSEIAIYKQYRSTSYIPDIPYVGMGIAVLVFAFRAIIYRARTLFPDLCLSVLICLTITSNQFLLAPLAKTGEKDMEFRQLANWYLNSATPGEKLVTTMPHVVKIFAPEERDNLIETSHVSGRSPSEFAQRCQLSDVTYVTWDSRIGYTPTNSYYHTWRIGNLRMWLLSRTQDNGPFEFVHKIKPDQIFVNRYINIFRMDRPKGDVSQAPEFQMLADWYMSQDGEKQILVSAKAEILRQLIPKQRHSFWHTGCMWGETFSRFLQACYRNRVTYIAWDSRSGSNPDDPHYKKWGLHRIQMLQQPKTEWPYEFVTQLKHENGEYINIFRLDTCPSVEGENLPEFESLATWYRNNVHFPEKRTQPQILITSAPELMRKFCSWNKDFFWHTSSILGNRTDEFLINCYRNSVHYVAWDSYNGNNTEAEHYKKWRLGRIKMLSEPRDYGPCKFVRQFKGDDGNYINLFSMQYPTSGKTE